MATLDDINILPEARFLTLDDKMAIAEQDDRRSPKSIRVGQLVTLAGLGNNFARGQVSVTTNTTPTNIISINTFEEAGINATLDTSISTTAFISALTDGKIGLRYTGPYSRIFWVYGSYDGQGSNNHMLAIRLAKNGASIPQTECRAFTGSNQQEAKLVCSWMIELSPNDTVSIMLANTTDVDDITIKRARLVANAIS